MVWPEMQSVCLRRFIHPWYQESERMRSVYETNHGEYAYSRLCHSRKEAAMEHRTQPATSSESGSLEKRTSKACIWCHSSMVRRQASRAGRPLRLMSRNCRLQRCQESHDRPRSFALFFQKRMSDVCSWTTLFAMQLHGWISGKQMGRLIGGPSVLEGV